MSVDVDANPGLLQAFQVQSVPVTLGLIQGQPVPLFAGVQSAEHVRAYVDELLKLAVQHGVTGRVDVGAPPEGAVEEEQPLPPLHQQAFEAIERDDLDGAVAAYEQALKENPADAEASRSGWPRSADAADRRRRPGRPRGQPRRPTPPTSPAQILVADLDLLGGHVEDAFSRLVETVRNTSGDERNTAREHLLELFQVIGAGDERVVRARRALTSALF